MCLKVLSQRSFKKLLFISLLIVTKERVSNAVFLVGTLLPGVKFQVFYQKRRKGQILVGNHSIQQKKRSEVWKGIYICILRYIPRDIMHSLMSTTGLNSKDSQIRIFNSIPFWVVSFLCSTNELCPFTLENLTDISYSIEFNSYLSSKPIINYFWFWWIAPPSSKKMRVT